MDDIKKETIDKLLDNKITIFAQKVRDFKETFNHLLLDRKEIVEIISVMEKNNWISDKDRIAAIKTKMDEFNG